MLGQPFLGRLDRRAFRVSKAFKAIPVQPARQDLLAQPVLLERPETLEPAGQPGQPALEVAPAPRAPPASRVIMVLLVLRACKASKEFRAMLAQLARRDQRAL